MFFFIPQQPVLVNWHKADGSLDAHKVTTLQEQVGSALLLTKYWNLQIMSLACQKNESWENAAEYWTIP